MEMQDAPILVAVGANLPGPIGTPLETCVWAAGRLAGLPGFEHVATSCWYETAPVPVSDQPRYVNGVVRLRGEADPHALLAWLHAIEAEAARVRGAPNGPRTLDLDLLAMGDLVVQDAVLSVPHPRLAVRAFVLVPLCDVAPGWVHPVLRCSASSLCAACGDTAEVRALP